MPTMFFAKFKKLISGSTLWPWIYLASTWRIACISSTIATLFGTAVSICTRRHCRSRNTIVTAPIHNTPRIICRMSCPEGPGGYTSVQTPDFVMSPSLPGGGVYPPMQCIMRGGYTPLQVKPYCSSSVGGSPPPQVMRNAYASWYIMHIDGYACI